MLRVLFLLLLLAVFSYAASGPVYVVLWFDTEDYIEPASDDAALRIARDLTAEGVHATFKVVGEKARVVEKRGRHDVVSALSKHAIGYHSNWHSVHPTPSEYLLHMGLLDGAEEFERREAAGVADVKRVFGVTPVCYGQPGNSWAPQSNIALRKLGIPVYLDEGDQVGLDEQPFWYGGMLYIFHMGRNNFRAQLNVGPEDPAAYKRFDEAAQRLSSNGGGVISIYYHPNEFVTTQFWDGPNFSHGANPPREEWVKPHRRTPEDSERCYGVLRHFVQHMKTVPGVHFVTARDLLQIYKSPLPKPVDGHLAAEQLSHEIVFGEIDGQTLSPADMLLALLGLPAQVVDGPIASSSSTYAKPAVSSAAFQAASKDAADFIRRFHRLPNEVFIGSETLSLPDFAATLAESVKGGDEIKIARGKVGFEGYFSSNGQKSFNWVIHREGFDGSPLLDLGKLQGWTLKPARLR